MVIAMNLIQWQPQWAGSLATRIRPVALTAADVGPTIIPPGMDLDDAVLLTDVVPTGYQAAEMGGIKPGDTVVVFGAGPIGIMAAKCSWLFGAGRVIVIDCLDYRLEFVKKYAQCEAYNYMSLGDPVLFLKKTTDYFGADPSAGFRHAPLPAAISNPPSNSVHG